MKIRWGNHSVLVFSPTLFEIVRSIAFQSNRKVRTRLSRDVGRHPLPAPDSINPIWGIYGGRQTQSSVGLSESDDVMPHSIYAHRTAIFLFSVSQ